MASIITATTTSGLTQSADNSGVLQLASGTGNLVTVPSVTGTAMVSGNMPAFSAYNSSNQTVSNATFTKITFNVETFDTNNNFASSSFTPTVAGYYQVNGLMACQATLATIYIVSIYKNGAAYARGNDLRGSAGFLSSANLVTSQTIYLNGSTDYIELWGYINASSGQTILGGGMDGGSYFSATLVRGA